MGRKMSPIRIKIEAIPNEEFKKRMDEIGMTKYAEELGINRTILTEIRDKKKIKMDKAGVRRRNGLGWKKPYRN